MPPRACRSNSSLQSTTFAAAPATLGLGGAVPAPLAPAGPYSGAGLPPLVPQQAQQAQRFGSTFGAQQQAPRLPSLTLALGPSLGTPGTSLGGAPSLGLLPSSDLGSMFSSLGSELLQAPGRQPVATPLKQETTAGGDLLSCWDNEWALPALF